MAEHWDIVVDGTSSNFSLNLRKLFKFKDLILLFTKRDIVVQYKQTILGPLWFFIQPILTTITFTIIFGKIAKIGPKDIPNDLFYLAGIVLWNFFSDCLLKTSETFITNQNLFSKVFFPRMAVPVSIVISNSVRFLIQFLLFIGVFVYYSFYTGIHHRIHVEYIWILPVLFFIISLLGLASGLIISALTTKYRDLRFLIQFAVQLLMYATPIAYPLSQVPQAYRWSILSNPMSSIVEAFKFVCFSGGELNFLALIYSAVFTMIFLFLGTYIFNKVEKDFIDVV